jgi:lycopene beta-cyclase
VLDVLVVGAGPSGRAVAVACGAHGLRTAVLDPTPARPWRATYGAWLDELPPALPASVIAATGRAYAVAGTRHDMGREYAVLDVPVLRAHLDERITTSGVRMLRGRFGPAAPSAAVVIDAGGSAQPLSRRHPHRISAEQTAAGVVLPSELAEPLLAPGEALFMDWRSIPGERDGVSSFLYAVPLGADRVLLEETSLARRPGMAIDMLTHRLHARLAWHGIRPPAGAPREVVRFPLDLPRHRAPDAFGFGPVGFGAAAPLTHPATGYQLATALQLAEPVAMAVVGCLSDRPGLASRAANAVLWPPSARLTHAMRRRGLECLLRLPSARLPAFFEAFFLLPQAAQRDYLGGRTDPLRTALAMAKVFDNTDWALRLRLIGSSLLVSTPAE